MKNIKIIIVLCLFNTPVFAYLGPGMGGGIIAGVLGVVGAPLTRFPVVFYG